MAWQTFPHEADIGVRGTGATIDEAFAGAAQALTAVICDPATVAARESFIMMGFADRQDDYRERMACYADVQEVLLDDCGHNAHHDQPEVLARLLDQFFAAPE